MMVLSIELDASLPQWVDAAIELVERFQISRLDLRLGRMLLCIMTPQFMRASQFRFQCFH